MTTPSMLVEPGIRQELVFTVMEASKPGNATYNAQNHTIDTRNRRDGLTIGGVTTRRFIVDTANIMTGASAAGGANTGSSFTSITVINVSNSNGIVAQKLTPTNANMGVDQLVAMTVGTTATTRNSVSVPNNYLLAADVIKLQLIGTNAADILAIGSKVILGGHWEDETQVSNASL